MDRKEYTPTKGIKQQPIQTTTSQSYLKHTPEGLRGPQLTLLKEYESLKIQVRQLQTQNRSLSSQVERLKHQKVFSENKYLQKMSFEEQTLSQFQKQKNYQLELLQLKHDEDTNRIRRQCQQQVQDLLRQLKNKEYQIRQKCQQIDYLELKNSQLNKELNALEKQLIKSRDTNSEINQLLTKQEFANKKLQMLSQELQRHKDQMESQIHVLLDIQAEKSKTINYLQSQLRASENNQKNLNEKLILLTDNFNALEDHISVMKQKLLNADAQNRQLEGVLDKTQLLLREKEALLIEQNNREASLRNELEEQLNRQRRRQKEVVQLMDENQRLYKELNITRHRLHEFGVAYGIDI